MDPVDWLLACDEPAVRAMASRDLLDRPRTENVLDGPWLTALLTGPPKPVHPYSKWTGAHWRLISAVELEVPPGEPRAMAAAETVLDWLTNKRRVSQLPAGNGLPRSHASMEGNALAACCRLGLADDPRVRLLVELLLRWQWPDGGWNCDARASGRVSSFHESLSPMWGLWEYAAATADDGAARAARRTAELLLDRRLFRRKSTGDVIHRSFVVLHYPPYWHYDILQALLILTRMGLVGDPRAGDAIDVLEQRRLPDGRWRPGAYWWRSAAPSDGQYANEVVDWGRSGPSPMLTLNALRVLRARAAA